MRDGGGVPTRTVVRPVDVDGGIGVEVAREAVPAPRRVTCPFYGFVGHRLGVMMGQGGNACALAFGHAPCAMEMAAERPDWDGCGTRNPLGNGGALPGLAEFSVLPMDGPSGGIPLPEWFSRVMGREWPGRA